MSRSFAAQRPLVFLLAALLAAFGVILASLSVVPSASAVEDDATQTARPVAVDDSARNDGPAVSEDPSGSQPHPVQELPAQAASVPPLEDFVVEFVGPECWDSSYNVSVEYDGDSSDLRVALQEDADGVWVTLRTERFYDGMAFVYSDHLDEGRTTTFQVVVYDRTAAAEQTVLHGPTAVTGVSTEECEEPQLPTLPEDQWTVAESGCGSVTFTSRADEEVVVLWFGEDIEDDVSEEDYFFLAPGQSRTVQTTQSFIYWISAAGVDENLEPIGEEVLLAGEGEIEVRQNCAPAEPTQPAEPAEPAEPGDDDHKVPGKVQTDGGADVATLGLGALLMLAAGLGLVRRTV